MEGTYDVMLGPETVGQVTVAREGLYCRFRCRCDLSTDVCRLRLSWNGGELDLGTLIPEGKQFVLETRIPSKRLPTGKPVFSVIPSRPVFTGQFIPIHPEEPFAYLERLKDAYLEIRNDQRGIVIPVTDRIN